MIKAIFLDFDGTTFSHTSHSIPASTIEGLKKLKEKGILTFLATGRSKLEMTWFDIDELLANLTGSVLNNGQLAIDPNNNVIYDEPIEDPLKSELIRIFNEKKIPLYLITYDDIFINFVNDNVRITQELVSSPIPDVKEYCGQQIYMASAFFKDDIQKEEIYRLPANITCWQEGALDIVADESCKSKGIDEVLKVYGIDISETMAFGDGENDIDMLNHCGIGVAMGNSKKVVKDIADYVTDDIDNDGIYNALVHFNLI